MLIVQTPVAGAEVRLRAPSGAEELLLLEAGLPDLHVALALLGHLAYALDGKPFDVSSLPIGDVDALFLRLRQQLVGDVVRTDALCPASGCGARVTVTFSIGEYLEHHAPSPEPQVVAANESGWYRLTNADVELRVPIAADQLVIAQATNPEEALIERCVRATELSRQTLQQVEAVLERIAPNLCAELVGCCAECSAEVRSEFDPIQFTLRELHARAVFLYDDVARIAHHYHWSEADILALPVARRERYADLASRERNS